MVVASEPRLNIAQLVAQAQASSEPVVLTTSGEAELVVLTPQAYQALLQRLDYWESVASIRHSQLQFERGEDRDAREAFEELRQKLGVPR